MISESVGPDVNVGAPALAVIWTLTSIAILTVIARCYTQHWVSHQLGLSDALIILSVATITGMASLITVQYHYGWGRHYVYLNPHERLLAIKFNSIGQSFGVMGSTWGRLSFIVFMAHLFGTTKLRYWSLWMLFWAQLISNGVVVITLYIQCDNVNAIWDFSIESKCWDREVQVVIGYAHSAWNGATDLFLTCLPAVILWNLQMKLRLKIGLGILLSLSFFAFIGVIMKIIKLHALSEEGDYTYNTVPLFTWVIVESTLVVFAASVPLLRPLFKRMRPDGSTRNTYEMEKYGKHENQNSISSKRTFGRLDSNKGGTTGDGTSEDGILPMRNTDSAIFKETSYTVRIRDLEEGEKLEDPRGVVRVRPWERP